MRHARDIGKLALILLALTLGFWLLCGCCCVAASNKPTISDSPAATLNDIRGLLVDASTNTNDGWAYRVLAVGAAITLVSYPAGKLVWIIAAGFNKRLKGSGNGCNHD